MPALALWGEQDPWLGASWADAYAERLPHAHAVKVPDAGHWPWLDRPDTIDLVVDFIGADSA